MSPGPAIKTQRWTTRSDTKHEFKAYRQRETYDEHRAIELWKTAIDALTKPCYMFDVVGIMNKAGAKRGCEATTGQGKFVAHSR